MDQQTLESNLYDPEILKQAQDRITHAETKGLSKRDSSSRKTVTVVEPSPRKTPKKELSVQNLKSLTESPRKTENVTPSPFKTPTSKKATSASPVRDHISPVKSSPVRKKRVIDEKVFAEIIASAEKMSPRNLRLGKTRKVGGRIIDEERVPEVTQDNEKATKVRNAISDLATTTQQRRKIDAADRELQDEIDKARRQISKSLTKTGFSKATYNDYVIKKKKTNKKKRKGKIYVTVPEALQLMSTNMGLSDRQIARVTDRLHEIHTKRFGGAYVLRMVKL